MTEELSKWSAKIKCNDVSTNSLNYHKNYTEKSRENTQIHQIPKTHRVILYLARKKLVTLDKVRTNPCQTNVYTFLYQEGVIGEIDIY